MSVNLRWCAAAAAADAAARLGLVDPRYRDERGAWWTVTGGRWRTWSEGAWHTEEPPDWVEGPATDLPAAPASSASAPQVADNSARELGPGVVAAASQVAAAYHAGHLSSDAAEAVLSRLYTVDGDGRIWTVGVRSGRWHQFHDGHWQQVDAAPDPTRVIDREKLDDDSLTAVRAGLAVFLASDEQLPESVTEPWLPAASQAHAVVGRATHRVPSSGLPAWESPKANAQPFGSLSGGLEVEVLERAGAWARISSPGGTTCWVDGRLLIKL